MDYQPAILGGLGDHDHLLTLASGAIDLARQAGITVAYVRVAFADQDYEQVPEANKMLGGVARSRALQARFGDGEPAVPGGYERACRAGARGRRAGAAGSLRFLNLMTASRQTAKMNSSADTPVRERKRTVTCSG